MLIQENVECIIWCILVFFLLQRFSDQIWKRVQDLLIKSNGFHAVFYFWCIWYTYGEFLRIYVDNPGLNDSIVENNTVPI